MYWYLLDIKMSYHQSDTAHLVNGYARNNELSATRINRPFSLSLDNGDSESE